MKERPILMSAPMVRAILGGTKTQTRRVVKPQPDPGNKIGWFDNIVGRPPSFAEYVDRSCNLVRTVLCPYGAPGDRLWVRETWRSWRSTCDEDNVDDDHECYEHCDQTYVAYRATPRVGYRPVPDRAAITFLHESSLIESDRRLLGPWKPAIHMPRWASRITLEVTGVRVERLHAITDADVEAEGATADEMHGWLSNTAICKAAKVLRCSYEDPRAWFGALWIQINGAASWDANPWVWVIEFRRLEAQERAA